MGEARTGSMFGVRNRRKVEGAGEAVDGILSGWGVAATGGSVCVAGRLQPVPTSVWINPQQTSLTQARQSPTPTNPNSRVDVWRGGLGGGLVCFRPFRLPVP